MKIFNFIQYSNQNLSSDTDLVFFLKPETSLLKNSKIFFLPEFSTDIRCRMGIVIKICKLGKYINEKFAHTYYKEFGICINLTAQDLLEHNIKAGLPWDRAVSFDNSTILGNFLPIKDKTTLLKIDCKLMINDENKAHQFINQINMTFDKAIELVSKYYTLKIGDYLIIEVENNPISFQVNDKINAFISNEKKIEFIIK